MVGPSSAVNPNVWFIGEKRTGMSPAVKLAGNNVTVMLAKRHKYEKAL